jgi:hypothetical protein
MSISPSNAQIHREFAKFFEGPSVADRAEALTALMSERVLSRYSKEPEFAHGLAQLVEASKAGDIPQDRLLALAQLVRISQALKPLAVKIRESVLPVLKDPLPALNLLKAGDDRAYVAIACRWADSAWVLDYAAKGIVHEETAEKARTELVGVLFSRVSCISEVLSLIREHLSAWRPSTDEPADSMARRITRILSAIRGEIANSRLPPGPKPGELLANLIRVQLDLLGSPREDTVKIALASEALLLIHAIVRTRFSLATDPTAYAAARVAYRIFGTSGWPGKIHDHVEPLIDLMLEAILLLALQGIAAESIVEQLAFVVDNRIRTEALLSQLAIANPEIPESVRVWLRREPTRRTSNNSRIDASQDLRADPAVADALLQAWRLEDARHLLRTSIVPSLSVLDPSQVPLAASLDGRIEALVRSVEEIGTVRRLMLLGTVGTEQQHQPKFFELVDGIPKETVRILRPSVVRMAADGSPGDVVLKGLAE